MLPNLPGLADNPVLLGSVASRILPKQVSSVNCSQTLWLVPCSVNCRVPGPLSLSPAPRPEWIPRPRPQRPPFFFSGASRSVGRPPPDRRKEPSRAKLVRLASKAAVTPHSFSRRCFRSRQAAKAQPTAWLSLSPCGKRGQAGLGEVALCRLEAEALVPPAQCQVILDQSPAPVPAQSPRLHLHPEGNRTARREKKSQKQECSAVWLS